MSHETVDTQFTNHDCFEDFAIALIQGLRLNWCLRRLERNKMCLLLIFVTTVDHALVNHIVDLVDYVTCSLHLRLFINRWK